MRNLRLLSFLWISVFFSAAALLLSTRTSDAHAQTALKVIPYSELCVTEGKLLPADGRIAVTVPKMRAVATTPSSHVIEVRFVYQGPTEKAVRLQSGELREQLGLKLRAEDGCNVVYAMWRIAPQPKLVVSVKFNPTHHSSSECGNAGYTNIKPRKASVIPLLQPGTEHVLRAGMQGEEMTVWIDGKAVWEGILGPDATKFDGPVGLRSDNVRFEFTLFGGVPRPNEKAPPVTCSDS